MEVKKSASGAAGKGSAGMNRSPALQSAPTAAVNANQTDFTFVGDQKSVFDLKAYYAGAGVEANVTIKEMGAVKVPDEMTTALPGACRNYKIGFSIFHTLDEVDATILDSMKSAAVESGVTLLVHDADYKQDAQNKAVEQWINEKVDGVILAPCDFTGVKTALEGLAAANIPVVTLNAPLAGCINAAVISDTVEQGAISGELLEQALLAGGKPMKGEIVYQTLPFMHPNAATRAKGFIDVFTKYPDVKISELTGVSPEDHFTAFDKAIKANPDMLGAWGLYSSATIGMMKARKENGSNVPLTSVDNDKPILAGIFDGELLGTSAYSAIAPARWIMSEMVNLLNGAPVPGIVFYENMQVTKENVEEAFAHYYPGKTLKEYLSGK